MIIYFMLCNVEILPSCKHIVIFAIVKMFIIHSLVGEESTISLKVTKYEEQKSYCLGSGVQQSETSQNFNQPIF